MTTDPRKALVQQGYDAVADRYASWIQKIADDPRDWFVSMFADQLPSGASVLDLGCGGGVPSTRWLAERFTVTGADISSEQVARAQENVPKARFIQSDLTALRFAPMSFDGVVSLYALSHVPVEEHAELFERVASWLRPGGQLLVTLGSESSPSWEGEWLDVPMFFSSNDAATNRELITGPGLRITHDELVTMHEPEGEATFHWILATASRSAVGRIE